MFVLTIGGFEFINVCFELSYTILMCAVLLPEICADFAQFVSFYCVPFFYVLYVCYMLLF